MVSGTFRACLARFTCFLNCHRVYLHRHWLLELLLCFLFRSLFFFPPFFFYVMLYKLGAAHVERALHAKKRSVGLFNSVSERKKPYTYKQQQQQQQKKTNRQRTKSTSAEKTKIASHHNTFTSFLLVQTQNWRVRGRGGGAGRKRAFQPRRRRKQTNNQTTTTTTMKRVPCKQMKTNKQTTTTTKRKKNVDTVTTTHQHNQGKRKSWCDFSNLTLAVGLVGGVKEEKQPIRGIGAGHRRHLPRTMQKKKGGKIQIEMRR